MPLPEDTGRSRAVQPAGEAPAVRDGRAFIGEIPANRLADLYGTPLYALDAAIIRANLQRLRAPFGHLRMQLYYSVKANPSLGVLALVRAAGARLDVCSPGDLAFAAAAGFTPEQLSYAGCSMSDEELAGVAKSDVPFTADSLSQVERIGRLRPGGAIGLRLNCGIEAGFHPHVRAGGAGSKFGIHVAQLPAALRLADRLGLRVVGLHGHLGSGLIDPEPHIALLDALLGAAASVPQIEWIGLGGGFADLARYDVGRLAAEAGARLAAAERRLQRELELRLEPGGCIVIGAGCLLARVTELKPPVDLDGRATPAFVGVDSSHNHLVSAVIYDTEHPIVLAERVREPPGGRFEVVGNLMQGGDVLARGCPLPLPRPGEVLVIGRCGGYAAWRASSFNERPRPGEVLVDGEEATLTRRAETCEDLLARERLREGGGLTAETRV